MFKVAKEFKWEMSHRLPFHDGPCGNVHGHTYKLRIEITGDKDENSMVIDYYDIEHAMRPIVERLDHSFICDSGDTLMIDFLKENGFRYNVMEGYSTAENIAEMILDEIFPEYGKFSRLKKIGIRLYETEDAFAEIEREL